MAGSSHGDSGAGLAEVQLQPIGAGEGVESLLPLKTADQMEGHQWQKTLDPLGPLWSISRAQ
jgi:hypothetical protein